MFSDDDGGTTLGFCLLASYEATRANDELRRSSKKLIGGEAARKTSGAWRHDNKLINYKSSLDFYDGLVIFPWTRFTNAKLISLILGKRHYSHSDHFTYVKVFKP